MNLKQLSCVGDVRGLGLMWTVEFLADSEKRIPFPQEFLFSERVFEALRARGVMLYPGRGTVDGDSGDHILIAPPFVIEESQIDFMVDQLGASIEEVAANLKSE
jgi:adenosylmethionine-8-amino-7-oxononanoate aminotransferase